MISYTILSVLAVDILALIGDLGTTWTSPMFMKMSLVNTTENPIQRPITEEEESLIGAISSLGSMIGTLPFGWICERFGRRMGLLSVAIPHFISLLMYTFGTDIMMFNCARFLSGFAVGGGYVIIPLYVAEIAEDSNRGRLSATVNIFWTLGSLIPLAIGPFMSAFYFNLFLSTLPILFALIFFTAAIESPYYLVAKNRFQDAEKSLMYLRSNKKAKVQCEMLEIKEYIANCKEATIFDLLTSRVVLKAVIFSIILVAFQEFTGIVALLGYVQPIFEASGSKIPSDISSVIVGVVIFLSSFVTLSADKVGRKVLIIVSSIGTCVCNAALGVYFYLYVADPDKVSLVHWLPLTTIIIFMLFYSLSIPWTISSELLPSNMRSAAATVTALTYWVCEFMVTKFFTIANSFLTVYGTFWFFSGCCLTCALFTFLFVPETKGKSLSEIQRELCSYKRENNNDDE